MAAKAGCGGLFLALPTQATSDGLFSRVLKWIDKLNQSSAHTIHLAHGKAQFSEEFQELPRPNQVGFYTKNDDKTAAVIVNDWFRGRKRGILADFVVGTIDQILMAGLKQKHLALRHLALANKVIILDECHAYDAYMSSYLYKVLSWLGTYRVPVIVLSATLPNAKRMELVDAYRRESSAPVTQAVDWLGIPATQAEIPEWANTTAYPLITHANEQGVTPCKPERSSRSLRINLQKLDNNDLASQLEKLLADGGCAGIIVNTVARAQEIAMQCRERFGAEQVELHHSQFIAPDRINREEGLRAKLGPPVNNSRRPQEKPLIVVGTQVLEQSLDIDFDVLFTDICPMDLLIQRMGRLHRHAGRKRPDALTQAQCYVLGINEGRQYEKGSEIIYGKYLLMNTDLLLPPTMILPDDISGLVQQAYSAEGLEDRAEYPEEYREAQRIFTESIEEKKNKALSFQVSAPEVIDNLTGWLDTVVSDDTFGKRGEATVRDTGDSIEVLIIQQQKDGGLCLLPWIDDCEAIVLPYESAPQDRLARTLARCSVRLPTQFCTPWNIGDTIQELETNNLKLIPDCWHDSEWLHGELFLVLDEEYRAELCGQALRYSKEDGLLLELRKEEI
jgi:CRISPR-associated endonuclease/helicase Cas3